MLMVRDYILEQAASENKKLPEFRVYSQEVVKILGYGRVTLTTSLDPTIFYEVTFNKFRKDALIDVHRRISRTRVSDHVFNTKHPEFVNDLNANDE